MAEGVEWEKQRRFLARLGCEEAHGWLFGRPVPAEVQAAPAFGPGWPGLVPGRPGRGRL